MNLVKSKANEASLDEIVDRNNKDFVDNDSREEFICALGADGFSNKFILTFWNLFRSALFKVANECFASGHLTENFRNANIKLIPKKGDL